MLQQLEEGKFETVAVKPPKSLEAEMAKVQQETMIDVTQPLQTMFDDMFNFVSEAFV